MEAHLCHRPGLQSKHFGVLITACISAVPGEKRVRETIKGGGDDVGPSRRHIGDDKSRLWRLVRKDKTRAGEE